MERLLSGEIASKVLGAFASRGWNLYKRNFGDSYHLVDYLSRGNATQIELFEGTNSFYAVAPAVANPSNSLEVMLEVNNRPAPTLLGKPATQFAFFDKYGVLFSVVNNTPVNTVAMGYDELIAKISTQLTPDLTNKSTG